MVAVSAFELIPALDLVGGQVVRLEQGDYARQTVHDADPAKRAAAFVSQGAPRLHVVDLEGARDGSAANEPALRDILAAAAPVPVQVGGGVRTEQRMERLLELGCDRLVVGTVALEEPELVRRAALRWPGRLVLGLDARDGLIAVRGWRETSSATALDVLARFADLPLAAVLHTDIARDGLLQGPNVAATEALARETALPVLASGGVGNLADLVALARTRVIAGAIVGKALYTGAVTLPEALEEIASC